MKRLLAAAAAGLLVVLCASPVNSARSGAPVGEGDFAMYVAPSTLVLDAPCPWVTIHTGVPYSAVEGAAVEINGGEVPVAMTYADSRGQLVAKLKFAPVAERCDPPSATVDMMLVIGGEAASATAMVTVK